MIVYDLICAHQHRFEGWFDSAEDYARQRGETIICCPICDDTAIERRPSANVVVGRQSGPAKQRKDVALAGGDGDALRLVRRLIEQTENVGRAFPEEARKIHYDEAPKRGIRGQATREEAEELRDEGIDFLSLAQRAHPRPELTAGGLDADRAKPGGPGSTLAARGETLRYTRRRHSLHAVPIGYNSRPSAGR